MKNNNRPVILCFVAYYFPGFRGGGPIKSIVNFVDHFGEEFEILIVTRDRDLHDKNPYVGFQINEWNKVGNSKVFYGSEKCLSFQGICRLIRDTPHDVLYLNSFWNPRFTLLPLLTRLLGLTPKTPCVIAPRGEFSSGALAIKATKKRFYLLASRMIGLYAGLRFQASSPLEKADILRAMPWVDSSTICVAKNLAQNEADIVNIESDQCSVSKILRVCFLSRISPKKNLDFALRTLAKAQSDVLFTIYGPKEDLAYWRACEALIDLLPHNVRVVYGGELHPTSIKLNLSGHDLFYFPTRGENYGHVIHEALSAGVPVLISDQTPWLDLEARGVGWALSLGDAEKFTSRIDDVASWSSERRQTSRMLARAYAEEVTKDREVVDRNRTLFMDLIKQRSSEEVAR